MKVHGENFQSWEEFDLELNGLTVLTGASNLGKSAIYRAIRGFFRNELKEQYVRDDQPDPLTVSVELNGQKITASRSRSGSAKYTQGKDKFKKLHGAVPEPVYNLGFNKVEIGDKAIDPIFASQSSPQFMLDSEAYGPTLLTSILGAFSSTEKLELGKKNANEEIRELNQKAKVLAGQVGDAEERKGVLEKLAQQAEVLDADIHRLDLVVGSIEPKLALIAQVCALRDKLERLQSLHDALSIPDTQEVAELDQKEVLATNATNYFRRHKRLARLVVALNEITELWEEIQPLEKQRQVTQDTFEIRSKVDGVSGSAIVSKLNQLLDLLDFDFKNAQDIEQAILLVNMLRSSGTKLKTYQSELVTLDCELISFRSQEDRLEEEEQRQRLEEQRRKAQEDAQVTVIEFTQPELDFVQAAVEEHYEEPALPHERSAYEKVNS